MEKTANSTASSREISPLNIYHVVSVGAGKLTIFSNENDYATFIGKIKDGCLEPSEVIAWCLMSNHFHLLIEGDIEEISEKMRNLLCSYARIFNNKHGRTGSLFQGRFYSEPIKDERQLLNAVRYIHQNPEKAGLAKFDCYQWSSYNEFTEGKVGGTQARVLDAIGGKQRFGQFHSKTETEAFLDETYRSRISDSLALTMFQEALGNDPLSDLKLKDTKLRAKIFQDLKNKGLSAAQIQRVSGMTLSTVKHALYYC